MTIDGNDVATLTPTDAGQWQTSLEFLSSGTVGVQVTAMDGCTNSNLTTKTLVWEEEEQTADNSSDGGG